MKKEYVWVIVIEDIFGGYGLRSTGKTLKQARAALWSVYCERSPIWNNQTTPESKSYKELTDSWGVWESKYEIGKGYFGGEIDDDIAKATGKETKP